MKENTPTEDKTQYFFAGQECDKETYLRLMEDHCRKCREGINYDRKDTKYKIEYLEI